MSKERAREILSVVVEDPNVDATDTEEVLTASLELADDLCLGSETEQQLRRLAEAAIFATANNLPVSEASKDWV